MDELLEKVKKELKEIGNAGISAANLDVTYKLVDIAKDIGEIKEQEEKLKGGKGMRYSYDSRYEGDYGRRGHDGRLAACEDRIAEGRDSYEYCRSRYRGDDERVIEGLEKLMYGVCMFVETAMNFAESPEEKEVIRKHVRKLESM